MEENKYEPLNEQEYNELKEFTSTIGAYLPENKTGYVWGLFNQLRNENEPKPCNCGSAAGHWKRAIDYLVNWVNERN